MNTYSFRADHIQDVFELMLLPEMRTVQRLTILPDASFPDVEVELISGMAEDEMLHAISQLEDAHVIAETFRMCALTLNPLQRGEESDPFPSEPEF